MKKILLSVAVIALLAVRANADVLASYPFTGSSRNSTDADPNSVATAFNDGPGWTSAFDAVRGNPTPSLGVDSTQIDGTTQGAAVTANDYWTFTLSPTGGSVLNLTDLTFDFANYTNDGTFPTETFFARSSIDSFAANLAGASTATTASAGAFGTATISLTGAAFQNLSSTIEFRIYLSDGTTDVDRGALIDNITVNGTTVVPEPATWMLMGVGLLLGAQRLRRKS